MEQGVIVNDHPANYEDEIWHGSGGTTLRQMVFGMNDGLVATVGLVAGLIFAGSSKGVVLGGTLAAIIAAVSSMALGSYLATQAEVGYQLAQIRRERREIEEQPHEELNEMRQIYHGYGLSAQEVDIFLSHFQRDKDLWLRLMLRDELGIIPESFENPWKNAGLMALAVAAGSLPPLLPVLFGSSPKHVFVWVLIFSALTAFGLGGVTARSTGKQWWRSAISFLIVATIAAAIGMGAGSLIAPLFG
ncbi:VIT1/CCC1 transporter family protein [Sulfobacillus harzensis]|uniref:VIT family protein n=1 Tax=Sulfobacillus harzensis TaxID=2729629 RepID=A0A7Y0Q3N6_9FIRM|nr:VIT1/CCC1 transporter family protein [Sulfobacillus harzensis]NMP23176.1 hypothetical protein [Sulfobacillus harzensis]